MNNYNIKRFFYILIAILTIICLVSCKDNYEQVSIRRIENNQIKNEIMKIHIPDGFPIYEFYTKAFEYSENIENPENIDRKTLNPENVNAIYYPLVSELEKNEFYEYRYGQGRALNVKVIVRQENFDERLLNNDSWYPHPKGITIKGQLEPLPKQIADSYRLWEDSEHLGIPAIILDRNPLLFNVEEIIPHYEENFNIKVGFLVEDNREKGIIADEIEKGFKIGIEYFLDKNKQIFEDDPRPVEVITKIIDKNNTVQAKNFLTELYEKEKVVMAGAIVSYDMAKELVSIAKEKEKLLFIDYPSHKNITTKSQNKYIFKTNMEIYQKSKAIAEVIDKPNSKIVVITEDNEVGKIGFNAIKDSIDKKSDKNIEIVKHLSINTNDKINYDFSSYLDEIKNNIENLNPTHIIVFWNIYDKDPSEALYYTPLPLMAQQEWIKEKGIKVVIDIPSIESLNTIKGAEHFIGSSYYHYRLAEFEINDFLHKKAYEQYKIEYPDTSMCRGNIISSIIMEIIRISYGNFDVHNLFSVINQSEFRTPKGYVKFREEDNQILQYMFIAQLELSSLDDLNYTLNFYDDRYEINFKDIEPPIKK